MNKFLKLGKRKRKIHSSFKKKMAMSDQFPRYPVIDRNKKVLSTYTFTTQDLVATMQAEVLRYALESITGHRCINIPSPEIMMQRHHSNSSVDL